MAPRGAAWPGIGGRGVMFALVLLIVSGSLGCASGDAAREAEALPSLRDLRDGDSPRARPEPRQTEAPAGPRLTLHMRRLYIPLQTWTDPAWAVIDESGLTDEARYALARNGVRMGVIARRDLPEFYDRLPPPRGGTRAQLMFRGGHPLAVREAPAPDTPIRVLLPPPPDQAEPETVDVRTGRMRLLARVQPAGAGSVYLSLVPHHQQRRGSIIPRDPLEASMEGRIFHELAAGFPIRPDQVVVVGLSWRWPELIEQARELAEDMDDGEPFDYTRITPPTDYQPPALPPHLGQRLLTHQTASRPYQTFILISAQPLP